MSVVTRITGRVAQPRALENAGWPAQRHGAPVTIVRGDVREADTLHALVADCETALDFARPCGCSNGAADRHARDYPRVLALREGYQVRDVLVVEVVVWLRALDRIDDLSGCALNLGGGLRNAVSLSEESV